MTVDVPSQPDLESRSPALNVSRFEAALVRVVRFLLGFLPAEQVANVFTMRSVMPNTLGANCLTLIKDALAKGTILRLVRGGGWRSEKHLRGLQPRTGRGWERDALQARQLVFTRHPLAFAQWLTTERIVETKQRWDVPYTELTAADEVFFFFAYQSLRGAEPLMAEVLRTKRAFRGNALCWLFFGGDFATTEPAVIPSFEPWMTGLRMTILECLQPMLHQQSVDAETAKGDMTDWASLRQSSRTQHHVLSEFLKVSARARRTDLGRFVLSTAKVVLNQEGLSPSFWYGSLSQQAPPKLSERLDTHRAAMSFLQHMATLQHWDRQARTVSYWDDDYHASQLWKEDWEAAGGDKLAMRATNLLAEIEPLRTG